MLIFFFVLQCISSTWSSNSLLWISTETIFFLIYWPFVFKSCFQSRFSAVTHRCDGDEGDAQILFCLLQQFYFSLVPESLLMHCSFPLFTGAQVQLLGDFHGRSLRSMGRHRSPMGKQWANRQAAHLYGDLSKRTGSRGSARACRIFSCGGEGIIRNNNTIHHSHWVGKHSFQKFSP